MSADVNHALALLIYILIGGLVVYAVSWFVGLLHLPDQVKHVILIVVAVLALVWLLGVVSATTGLVALPK